MHTDSWRDVGQGGTSGIVHIVATRLHATGGEACGDSLERFLGRTQRVHGGTHASLGIMARQCRRSNSGYGDQGTSGAAEFRRASGGTALEHVHDCADETVAILSQLAIASEVDSLVEQPESSHHKDLITVEAEGKAQFTLIEKLYDLNNVLTGIANGDKSG